jgi:hypothetical protein
MALLTHRSMVAGIVLGPSQLLRSQADCARSLRLLSEIFRLTKARTGDGSANPCQASSQIDAMKLGKISIVCANRWSPIGMPGKATKGI